MIQIGRLQTLRVLRETPHGVYLGDDDGDVLLPRAQVPRGTDPGHELEVFVHTDSEDQPIATTRMPVAVVGQLACMTVVDATDHGVFLDWGLPKDLFSPWRLQHDRMEVGRRYVVKVLLDERTNRVIAASKIARYLDFDHVKLDTGDEVEVMVYGFNDLGAQVVVDGKHMGMLYADPHTDRPEVGQTLRAWVVRVREDGRVDVGLRKVGRRAAVDDQGALVAALLDNDGFLPVHDRSSPEEIRALLGLSKKAFKKAAGGLYRRQQITIEADGIRLVAPKG